MDNPQYDSYPEGFYKEITIEAKMDDNGVWSVYCPQWLCELHDNNLTRCVAGLLSEIESHNNFDCPRSESNTNASTRKQKGVSSASN